METYAKLRNDLVTSDAVVDGVDVVNIKDPIRGNYFRLRAPEFWLISQLDGVTSYDAIAQKFRQKFNANIDAKAVLQFVELLESQYFLENSRSEQATTRKSYGNEKRKSLFSKLLFIKFKAFKPGKTLDVCTKIYKPFHSPIGLFLQFLFISFGLILFANNYTNFAVSLFDLYSASAIVTVMTAFFVLIVIHEFAHSIMCRIYGGEVNEFGFLLMYFQPCFYCDISDAWLFKKKSHRLAVTWAGPYSEIILLAFTMIIWRLTIPGSFIHEISQILVIVIWVTAIFNLNPLIKLDGYYLLSDFLEIPNLRDKSFNYVSNLFKRIVLGWPIEKIDVDKRKRRIYVIYATLAAVYTLFIIIFFLSILSSFLLEKTGTIGLILLYLFLMFAMRKNFKALANGLVTHIKYLKDIMKKPFRLVSYIVVMALLIIVLFFVPMKQRVSGEIKIEPIAEYSLLLNELGLLEKKFQQGGAESKLKTSYIQMASLELGSLDLIPYVRDGQHIAIGDTLAVLVSNQVTREIDSEGSVLEQLQSDLALLRSPPKKEAILEAEAAVASSKAVHEQKVRDEKRLKELVDKKLISNDLYEAAFSETAIAKADLQNKKATLSLLKSPPKPEEEAVILSQIEKQNAKLIFLQTQKDAQSIISTIPGTVMINQNNSQFLSVLDNSSVEVLVPVSDFDIDLLKLNQEVKIKVRSYTTKVFSGKVVHIPRDAIVDANDKASFNVSVVIENKNDILRKGMTGYAKIEIGRTSLYNLIIHRIASIIRVEFWAMW